MSEEIPEGYLRVSQIASQFTDFSRIPKDVLENAADRGTEAHSQIFALMLEIFRPPQRIDAAPYVSSFLEWEKENKFKLLLCEKRFSDHDLKITGEFDFLVHKDGEIFIIDLKATAKENKESWPIQGAFYYYLISNNTPFKPSRMVRFLQLRKDGKIANEYVYNVDATLLEAALAYLEVARYRMERGFIERQDPIIEEFY